MTGESVSILTEPSLRQQLLPAGNSGQLPDIQRGTLNNGSQLSRRMVFLGATAYPL